jgi:shikimate kinase/3-dehydroquinate synthase
VTGPLLHAVLSGPPASGKSSLGQALAERLGRPFIDTDARVEAMTGRSIPELFADLGEASFRSIERRALEEALSTSVPAVLSTGGGTLLDRPLRRRVLREAHVLGLSVSPEALLARIQTTPASRPLLAADPAPRLSALLDARAEAYAEVHATVPADGPFDRVLDDLGAALSELERFRTLVMPLGSRTYRVHLAPLSRLLRLSDACRPTARLLVSDARVEAALPEVRSLASELPHVLLPGLGDADKTLESLSRVWDAALSLNLDRRALLLGVGGGVVTDLAGFAAATLLRGVRAAHAPTTLLSMVDASVGGKTGIDHPTGKNLIGAFHQPAFVLCDTDALRTQPPRDLRAGLAEVAKIALVRDRNLLAHLARDAKRLRDLDLEALSSVVPAAIQAKIDVVAEDEREDGVRALLNFGHTLGHALEHGCDYRMPHGACVSVGMWGALALGERLGFTPRAVADEARALLSALGLPAQAEGPVDASAAHGALFRDKKRQGGALRFIFLTDTGAGGVFPVPELDARAALDGLLAGN